MRSLPNPRAVRAAVATTLALLFSRGTEAQAQSPDFGPEVIAESMATAVVEQTAAGIVASQARWTAGFPPSGLEFRPRSGPDAQRDPTVRFAVSSVTRGALEVLSSTQPSVARLPELDGNTVRYVHASRIVERLDVIDEGIKQSFEFAEPLPGEGDLVVRLDVATELVAAPGVYEGAFRLFDGDVPVVDIGQVIGVDADGRRVRGHMRWDGSHLDMVLPESFVEGASYPLVLDPLIGSMTDLLSRIVFSDVAYDGVNNVYLAVYGIDGFQNFDTYAQRIAVDGSLVGNRIGIELAAFEPSRFPRVAYVERDSFFYVAYEVTNRLSGIIDLAGVVVSGLDGSVGAPTVLKSNIGYISSMDMCGDRGSGDNDVIVAFTGEGVGVETREVSVNADMTSNLLTSRVRAVSQNPASRDVAICSSFGDRNRAVVAWQAVPDRVSYRVLSKDSDFLTQVLQINGAAQDAKPAVDGDGTRFELAFTQVEPDGTGTDVAGIIITFDSAGVRNSNRIPIAANPAFDEYGAAVATLRPSGVGIERAVFGVTWLQNRSTEQLWATYTILDPRYGHRRCAPGERIGDVGRRQFTGQMASRYAGGRYSDQALILLWQDGPFGSGVYLHAQAWEAFGAGGLVRDLGGGCGQGGVLTAPPIRIGDPDWRLSATGIYGGRSASGFLVVDFSQLPAPPLFSCGSCTALLPPNAPFIPLSVVNGEFSLPIAVVCDSSAFDTFVRWQFWTPTPALPPTCGWGSWSLSNILETTYGR